MRITSTGAALLTGTFRIRPTANDAYADVLTTASTFQGGVVPDVTNFTDTTDSTSSTTGAVTVTGGLGVAGQATLGTAVVLGNLSVNNVNLTAAGQFTLPDGSPFVFDTLANAANQQSSINQLNANVGTLYLGNVSTNANVGTLYLGNVSTNANLGAYQNYANANIGTLFLGNISTNANLGAYQIWANLTLSTVANAVNQQQNIDSLIQANVQTQANLGAYQTWANLTLSTVANAVNQQDAIDSLTLGNLSVNANIGAYQTYANTTASTFDANLGTVYLGNISTNANLGAYQTWANTTLAPLDAPAFTGVPTADTAAAGTNTTQLATTAFVFEANTGLAANVSSNIGQLRYNLVSNYAPLAAPAFTGLPTAPTAPAGQNDTQLATTAFVFEANTGLAANTSSNIGQLRYNLITNYAPLTAPVFQSNLFTGSAANVFVANGSTATFSSNVEIGQFDGTPANLTVRHGTPSSFGGFAYFMSNMEAAGNIIAAAPATFVSNVDIGNAEGVAANLTVRNGASASIFAQGNITVWRDTTPASSIGSSGDFPGILAYNAGILYICTGHYDGSTNIWGSVTVTTTAFP